MSLLAVCDACRQPLPKPIYRVGRLRMDTGSRRVYELNRRHRHGERELRLDRQEYDLLQTLMRRPGMAFACQVIAENLATDAQDPAALITKLVCTLRGKLPPGSAHIETVRGHHAYRIVP